MMYKRHDFEFLNLLPPSNIIFQTIATSFETSSQNQGFDFLSDSKSEISPTFWQFFFPSTKTVARSVSF